VEINNLTTPDPSKTTILLVEDEPLLADILVYALEKAGFVVDATLSGQKGLGLFSAKSYDFLILDINLRDLNGIEIYYWIKQNYPDCKTKVIFTTGATESSDLTKFFDKEQAIYLKKPFELKQLIELLN
jgi:two-component system, OmpR family, catabolic regulation response regulator CreB